MIEKISEKEYRDIPVNSSSSLKDFSMDRRKYYKRHILKDKKKEEDENETIAVTMGRLVETLLMEPERFDDQFYMSSCVNIPGGLMGDFITSLARRTLKATNKDGVVTRDFMDIAAEAHIDSKYKLSLETVIGKFTGTDAEIYFNELRTVQFNNLTVVNSDDVNNAEKIVKELKNNFITNAIVNLETGKDFEVLNQVKVSGISIDGLPLKAMLDKVIINHKKKTIRFIDLKCTWNVEKFFKEYYLFRRAYIQAFVYQQALISLTQDIHSDYYKYTVELPYFLVCDSINYYSPLIYTVSEKDIEDAYNGFEARGWKYPGVKDIITNLKWSLENDRWDISRENFENNGHVTLK